MEEVRGAAFIMLWCLFSHQSTPLSLVLPLTREASSDRRVVREPVEFSGLERGEEDEWWGG